MEIRYHGQSAFELVDDDTRILIDPWIEGNPHCEKSVSEFTDVDGVLVTHGAGDHFGSAADIAVQCEAPLYCDYATQLFLKKSDFPDELLNGMIYGQAVKHESWKVKIVDAHHLSKFDELEVIGPALAFIVSLGGEVIYHMGDTAIFGDMELYGQIYNPTVCLVPVGQAEGSQPDLHPDEAALVIDWIEPDLAVPMHYLPDSERPQQFETYCDERGISESTKIMQLNPGNCVEL